MSQATQEATSAGETITIELGGLKPDLPWVQETEDQERFYSQSQFAKQREGRIQLATVNEIPTNLGIMQTFSVHPRSLIPSAQDMVQFPVCSSATLTLNDFRIITYGEIMELKSRVGGGILGADPLRVRRHFRNRG